MKAITEFTVYSWMSENLNLQGNALMIYAIIFAWTFDGDFMCLSYKEFARAVNCSKNTAIQSIESLVKQNYIEKDAKMKDGVVYNFYRINPSFVPKNFLEEEDN